ncbi:cation diffusion facilitator family transporter [Acetobacter estunensis]|uniref:cation diffusion facilitator family transporter n=1 Tax=Acetobacter estunensis TaxID=104097 RepID=UPI001887CD73|nr:cation diffusion facilitator family transporter [Acetobacter estunensis]
MTSSSHDHDHDHSAHAAHGHGCAHDHGHDEHGHGEQGCDHGHGLFGHHHHAPASFGTIFAVGMAINTLYLVIEAVWGVLAHSLALLADAGHNLSDVLALGAAWLAHNLSQRAPSQRFTYGLRRSSILAALTNAVILLLVTGGIAWEAILRLFHPEPVAGRTVMIVAAIGILVNGATALMLMKGQKEDLNIRGAFLHMATDALASFAVVVTGAMVLLTNLTWLDPAISLAISVLIVGATWALLRDSLDMALDAVPRDVNPGEVEQYLRTLPGVTELHDLHIWAMSTTENALTAHLVRASSTDNDRLLETVGETLRSRFGIVHPTIQIETARCDAGCTLQGSGVV